MCCCLCDDICELGWIRLIHQLVPISYWHHRRPSQQLVLGRYSVHCQYTKWRRKNYLRHSIILLVNFFFFFTFKTTNVKAILQATCWTSTFLNIKPSGLWHFTCMCSFWKAVVQTDRLTTKKSRRHSLLLALFPLTDFFTLLFPHHQPWILIKCHSHIQSFLQRAKNLE